MPGQGRAGISGWGAAHQVDRTVADAEAAARQASLALTCRPASPGPERLLAMMAALQRQLMLAIVRVAAGVARQANDACSRDAR